MQCCIEGRPVTVEEFEQNQRRNIGYGDLMKDEGEIAGVPNPRKALSITGMDYESASKYLYEQFGRRYLGRAGTSEEPAFFLFGKSLFNEFLWSITGPVLLSNKQWMAKDGEEILKISDMTIPHIEDCIRTLQRNRVLMGDGFISAFNSELKRRDSLSIEGGFNCL